MNSVMSQQSSTSLRSQSSSSPLLSSLNSPSLSPSIQRTNKVFRTPGLLGPPARLAVKEKDEKENEVNNDSGVHHNTRNLSHYEYSQSQSPSLLSQDLPELEFHEDQAQRPDNEGDEPQLPSSSVLFSPNSARAFSSASQNVHSNVSSFKHLPENSWPLSEDQMRDLLSEIQREDNQYLV